MASSASGIWAIRSTMPLVLGAARSMRRGWRNAAGLHSLCAPGDPVLSDHGRVDARSFCQALSGDCRHGPYGAAGGRHHAVVPLLWAWNASLDWNAVCSARFLLSMRRATPDMECASVSAPVRGARAVT